VQRLSFVILGLVLSALGGCAAGSEQAAARRPAATIATAADATPLEILAAREVRRYVYLRTGAVLPVANKPPEAGHAIVFRTDEALGAEDHTLTAANRDGRTVLTAAGGTDLATLYAAYRLAEHMGVRFYLHGDVVPDERTTVAALLEDLKGLEETNEPLFATRGILPFHDFAEGPDWWNADVYKAVIAQLPKMRMNFLGLHTYPEPAAEPTVWIGLPGDVGEGHAVKHSYPSSYHNTIRDMHGYKARKTSAWSHGTARLFDHDAYGAEVMRGLCPHPTKPEACNELFARVGGLLGEAFTFAHRLGMKTCVGTQTPLKIPAPVRERLKGLGKDPKDPAVVAEVYEGIFRRIMQAYPLDYYWFWTPEGWTWHGAKQEQVDATLADFDAALAAYKAVRPGFTLATCGWVLGPPKNRALFDEHLSGEMPMSCINRQVGKAPLEPGFAKVEGRPRWAIPWLEDDPNLLAPQLWVGRMRQDAADARAYGCTGLLGIHWRTRVLGPNVSALAHAAWNQEGWTDLPQSPKGNGRHAPSGDFYLDWCRSQFGPAVAEDAARLFQGQDGRLPEPSTWAHGPGGLKKSKQTADEIGKRYTFLEAFAALEGRVRGAGNLSRFRWWLHQFRFMVALEHLRSAWGRGDRAAMQKALDAAYAHLLATVSTTGGLGTVANIEQHVLPMLELTPASTKKAAASESTSSGKKDRRLRIKIELRVPEDDPKGVTIVLNEKKNLGVDFDALLAALQDLRDRGLKADHPVLISPWMRCRHEWVVKAFDAAVGARFTNVHFAVPYGPAGPPSRTHIIVPAARTLLEAGEPLDLKVIVLSGEAEAKPVLYVRPLGGGAFRTVACEHVARGVWRVQVDPPDGGDFEYYGEVLSDGEPVRWPATAPALCHTVVVMPETAHQQ